MVDTLAFYNYLINAETIELKEFEKYGTDYIVNTVNDIYAIL